MMTFGGAGDHPADAWEVAAMGSSGLLVTRRGSDGPDHEAVRALYQQVKSRRIRGVSDLVPALDSLLVCYDPIVVPPADLLAHLRSALTARSGPDPRTGVVHTIEVVYGGAEGPDLQYVAATAGITEAEVIRLHTARSMPILMIGFMPGFPYIGGLPETLRLPRRAEPRSVVPAGSVAIANDQTGIYPDRSPGGWHVIGRTGARLFDLDRRPPALLQPGDYVQFIPQVS